MASCGATCGKLVFCCKSEELPPVVAICGATCGKLVFCSKGEECHQWWQALAPPVASLSSVGKVRSATSGGKLWRHLWQVCLLL